MLSFPRTRNKTMYFSLKLYFISNVQSDVSKKRYYTFMFCGRELRQFILKVDSEIKKQNSVFNKVSMRIKSNGVV